MVFGKGAWHSTSSLSKSPRVCRSGSSLIPVLSGFLSRLHYTGMIVPIKEGRSPPSSAIIKSLAPVVAAFQHTLKGIQGGDQERGTVLWENWQNTPSVRYFQEKVCMFLNFIFRKAPKPLIKISVPCDQPQPSTETWAWVQYP